tara:strand:- start:274 stop:684 length:411 start_codon:yes stop_codon:yes gene_type:complete
MSEKLEGFVQYIKDPGNWLRILITILFAVFLYFIIVPLVIVIMVSQILFNLFLGSSNANLREFSEILVNYVTQILGFVLYNSDEKPFPFSEFSSKTGNNISKADSVVSRSTPKVKRKSPAKKKTAKKTVKPKKSSE